MSKLVLYLNPVSMKIIYTLLLLLSSTLIYAQCEDAQTEIENAMSYNDDADAYAKKGYNSNKLSDAKFFAKKTMASLEDVEYYAVNAEDLASDCNCEDAEYYASYAVGSINNAYNYAKKAYYASTLEEAVNYLKKAISEIDDTDDYLYDAYYACEE